MTKANLSNMQSNSLSLITRIKVGEELVADASEWLDVVSDEFEDTILFAGDEAEATALRPKLAETVADARADLRVLEAKLSSLKNEQSAVRGAREASV